MHFVYIDESIHDRKHYVYSALLINTEYWRDCVRKVQALRRKMRKAEGIFVSKELHASEFVAGKGRISRKIITKEQRAEIFKKVMHFIVWLAKEKKSEDITLMNSININEERAFERLINRINRTMETFDSQAILIFDAGHEGAFTRRIRKMNVYNPIPSNRGTWNESGSWSKNIVIDRILEDPFFKDSKQSNFIQLVDFIAYALLRKEVQLPSRNALGIHEAFDILKPICFKSANLRDPLRMGVIR